MRWLFEDAQLAAQLDRTSRSWVGTPFRPHSKAKGKTGGVDCIGLCESIYVELGVVKAFSFPRTPMDYSMHQDNSIILDYLRGKAWRDPQSLLLARLFSELREPGSLLAGDLLCFRIGKCVHHLAIALDEQRFLHCFTSLGVTEANITDPTYRRRLVTIFRAKQRGVASNSQTASPART